MRTNNAKRNVISSVFSAVLLMIIGFFSQTIFIKILGSEYLGLNSLFYNILSTFSLVELGLGSAIVYSLYEPLEHKNIKKVKSLINFYKVSYRIIAIIIGLLSLIILPFIPMIVGENNVSDNIYIIFLLFSLNSICSYLITYRRSILYADQKSSIITNIHLLISLLLNFFQILFLILTSSYLIYLCLKIIFSLIENLAINYFVLVKYPYLKQNNEKIDKNEKQLLFLRVKGLIYHKIGEIIVYATDNILISIFIGLKYVGLYSNYALIVSSISYIIRQIFASLVASIGNLFVSSNINKNYEVYKKINFFNYVVTLLCVSCLINLLQNFIIIWLGTDYLLKYEVIIIICLNFYFLSMRRGFTAFKEAAGIFFEDRYMPVLEAIINLISSLIFIHYFGFIGVFLGTTISYLFIFLYAYPKYVFIKIFKKTYKEYFLNFINQLLVMIIIILITKFVIELNDINNIYVSFLTNGIYSVIIPIIVIVICFFKKPEFNYFINFFRKRRR